MNKKTIEKASKERNKLRAEKLDYRAIDVINVRFVATKATNGIRNISRGN